MQTVDELGIKAMRDIEERVGLLLRTLDACDVETEEMMTQAIACLIPPIARILWLWKDLSGTPDELILEQMCKFIKTDWRLTNGGH